MLKRLLKSILEPIFNINNKKYLTKYFRMLNKNKEIYDIDQDIKNIKKVLVIAPHQDDETIGLGGTISKFSKNNKLIDLLFMTDGRLINNTSNIASIRQLEAKNLKKIYNINEIKFIDIINNTLYSNLDYAVNSIEKEFNLKDYDVCFLTSRFDCHDDHRATFDVVEKLYKNQQFRENIIFYLYDINNSIQGNILNCISLLEEKNLKDKWNAYKLFKSQKYITFSTLKIMDIKRLELVKNTKFYNNKFKGLEYFSRLNKDQFENLCRFDNEFSKKMKTATSSIKLVKFLEINKKFSDKFNEINI